MVKVSRYGPTLGFWVLMSILISHRLLAKRLCWDFEKDGIYSVRSAYRTLMRDVWTSTEESTSNATHLWKKV